MTKENVNRNITAISGKKLLGEKITFYDLILLSLNSITVAGYYNAIQFLDAAAKLFHISSSFRRSLPFSYHLNGIVPYLKQVAKSGLMMQQTDPIFNLESRLLPFSTYRFDNGFKIRHMWVPNLFVLFQV